MNFEEVKQQNFHMVLPVCSRSTLQTRNTHIALDLAAADDVVDGHVKVNNILDNFDPAKENKQLKRRLTLWYQEDTEDALYGDPLVSLPQATLVIDIRVGVA